MVQQPRPQASNLYQAIGGSAACRKIAVAFYARVARDPVLRPLFPGKTFKCAIEELAAFLAQLLDGPPEDTQRRWWLSLRESHLRFKIRQEERDAWMRNMAATLDEAKIEEPARKALHELFERSSSYLVNTGPPAPVAERQSQDSGLQQEILHRWDDQRALDSAVAGVRSGDMHRVKAFVENTALFNRNRSVFASFVSLMIGSGQPAMADYANSILLQNPDLAHQRYSGRTLMHAASAAGNLRTIELLLNSGVDPNTKDAGGHTPLYSAANEGASVDIVRALVQAGANVDACDGVKHCTALHMAARRGNVEVSAALLDSGADIESRDSLGETPLRRAVNCGKTAVAALLLERGADPDSKGSKGLTPLSAARAAAMRNLLKTWTSR